MRQLAVVGGQVAPGLAVALHGLREGRRVVVLAFARLGGVDRLDDAPPFARLDQRVLHDVARPQINFLAVKGLALGWLSDALEHRYLAAPFVARLDLRQVFRRGDDLASETT